MDVKDSISVTLKTIDGKETKDQSAKNIFSYKPIMSNILKYTVEEYRDCSLEAPAAFDILFRSLNPKAEGKLLVNLHIDF